MRRSKRRRKSWFVGLMSSLVGACVALGGGLVTSLAAGCDDGAPAPKYGALPDAAVSDGFSPLYGAPAIDGGSTDSAAPGDGFSPLYGAPPADAG